MSAGEVAGELANMRIEPGLWELTSEVVEVRAPDLPREVRNRMVGPRSRLRNCITPQQAEKFRRDGALGSHLEVLQRDEPPCFLAFREARETAELPAHQRRIEHRE